MTRHRRISAAAQRARPDDRASSAGLMPLVELRDTRPDEPETHLIAAQVASMRHCFSEASAYTAAAAALGAPRPACERLTLTIN
jgi:hypothetical protein